MSAPTPRRAGRVLVIDPDGRVLLLHGFDPGRPGESYWFTPGGGADQHETLVQAAARELSEETGLVVSPGELGEPFWREITEFPFDGLHYRQEQDFFVLRVGQVDVTMAGMDEIEAAVVIGYRWWTTAELDARTETYYPLELPKLVRDITGESEARATPR